MYLHVTAAAGGDPIFFVFFPHVGWGCPGPASARPVPLLPPRLLAWPVGPCLCSCTPSLRRLVPGLAGPPRQSAPPGLPVWPKPRPRRVGFGESFTSSADRLCWRLRQNFRPGSKITSHKPHIQKNTNKSLQDRRGRGSDTRPHVRTLLRHGSCDGRALHFPLRIHNNSRVVLKVDELAILPPPRFSLTDDDDRVN